MADRHNKNMMSMRDDEEYGEEEVWNVVKEKNDISPKMKKSKSSAWCNFTSPRNITRANNAEAMMSRQSSAPLDIPDWSKIYGDCNTKNNVLHHHRHHHANDDYDADDDGDDEGMMPPHEFLARRLARTQISSFSVCEGIGRTLKGRDLSEVRNAILTKTGFLE